MTRIIAGVAGGRTLRTPPGAGTRPTSERVREAVFSAIEARDAVGGARVLDLFAGSGALGLEAASRGASHVVLVESDRRAAGVARSNARDLALPATVVTATVAGALAGDLDGPFDLVFLDPPYDLAEHALGAVLGALAAGRLREGAVVVVERSTRTPEPTWPDGIRRTGHRRYGETAVWYAEADGKSG